MSTSFRARAVVAALALVVGGLGTSTPAAASAPAELPVITAPADGASLSGDVTVAVQSNAPRVVVLLGDVVLERGAPSAGTFSFTWSTWGYGAGAAQLIALACDEADVCAATGDVVAIALVNTPPAITSPASGAVVQKDSTVPVVFTAAGTVAVQADGVTYYLGPSSPITFSLSLLAEGPHDLRLVACTWQGRCDGPISTTVPIEVGALHPAITTIAPNPFSPNGDGSKDSTTVTYTLDEPQDVVVWVVGENLVDSVLGPVALGRQAAGTHTWIWNGKTRTGARAPDGSYQVQLHASTAELTAQALAWVVLDAVAPTMQLATLSGAVFYPYADGYRDTFTPKFGLNEPASLKLVLRNSSGTTVRTLTGSRQPGIVGLAWNGRTAAGALVPAGVYTWQYTATDPVGNRRTGSRYTVTVSWKKLVTRTLTVKVNASSYGGSGRTRTCAYKKASGFGSYGAWLYNGCDSRTVGPQFIGLAYRVTLPKAISYTSLSVGVYGHTHAYAGQPAVSAIYGWIQRLDEADSYAEGYATARGTTSTWYRVASSPAAGYVNMDRQVYVGWGVENFYVPPPNDFDARYLRVAVVAKVLV